MPSAVRLPLLLIGIVNLFCAVSLAAPSCRELMGLGAQSNADLEIIIRELAQVYVAASALEKGAKRSSLEDAFHRRMNQLKAVMDEADLKARIRAAVKAERALPTSTRIDESELKIKEREVLRTPFVLNDSLSFDGSLSNNHENGLIQINEKQASLDLGHTLPKLISYPNKIGGGSNYEHGHDVFSWLTRDAKNRQVIQVFNLRSKEFFEIPMGDSQLARHLSPSGRYFISLAEDDQVHRLDFQTGKIESTAKSKFGFTRLGPFTLAKRERSYGKPHGFQAVRVRVEDTGEVTTYRMDGTWTKYSSDLRTETEGSFLEEFGIDMKDVYYMNWSPDGKQAVIAKYFFSDEFYLFDFENKKFLPAHGHKVIMHIMHWYADRVVTKTSDENATDTMVLPRDLSSPRFEPAANWAALDYSNQVAPPRYLTRTEREGADSMWWRVTVRDVETNETKIVRVPAETEKIPEWAVQVSRDGQRLAIAFGNQQSSSVRIYLVESGELLTENDNLPGGWFRTVRLSPDGNHVAVSVDKHTWVYRIQSANHHLNQ